SPRRSRRSPRRGSSSRLSDAARARGDVSGGARAPRRLAAALPGAGRVQEGGPRGVVVPKVGDTLGEFLLVREVGRGSMGDVSEATQRSLGRRVAVKVLTPSAAGDPVWGERFRAEANA